MDTQTLIYLFVGATFALYIGIALWTRAGSTSEYYVASKGVHPVLNGMATGADWMSAASFISMAGIIAFGGYDASVYLMGWTGGYVLLALLLAPYLRKFGQFTVPDFIGARYYSKTARVVAVICLIVISFTYIAGQMRGVGVVFSRFLEMPIEWGVVTGMAVVFVYAVFGGMKGITYTQVAQYCVLIFAYLVPAIFISMMITGNPVPQLGLGGTDASGVYVLQKLDATLVDLGFSEFTAGVKSKADVFAITLALMVGTAGLPHVIVRFFTVPKVSDARKSAGYALVFIALLYTTAPAVGAFARLNFIETVNGADYKTAPQWVKTWEGIGLIAWLDKNGDGKMQYAAGAPFEGKPQFTGEAGASGERLISNAPTANANEVDVDRDIMVLANPEIARLPNWADEFGLQLAWIDASSPGRELPAAGGVGLARKIGCDSVLQTLAEARCRRAASAPPTVLFQLDADTLVPDPTRFTLPDVDFAVGREVWVQADGRRWRVYAKVHNACLLFRRGTPVLRFYLETAQRLLRALAGRTDAVLNLTTGGAPTMSVAERIRPVVEFKPELASMNMGSMNFGLYPMLDRYSDFKHNWEADYLEGSRANIFRNSLADIEQAMTVCGAGGTRFEFECYDIGHLYTLAHFVARGLVTPPFFIQSVFGLLGGIGNHAEDIAHMRRTADRLFGEDYRWSVLGAGRHQMRVAAAGLTLGGNIRVGLEDNLWAGKGRLSVSNRDQVETARTLVEGLGLSVASPDEARAILGLKGRAKTAFSTAGARA